MCLTTHSATIFGNYIVFQVCYGTPAVDETLNPYEAAEQVEIDETPEAETAAEPESTPEQ